MILSFWNRDNIQSMKLYHRKKDNRLAFSYGMVLNVLSCTGIVLFEEHEKKFRTFACRIFGILFAILLHVSSVDYWVMSYISLKYNWHEYQVVLSLVLSNSVALLLWHTLYRRRKQLRMLLLKMDAVCYTHFIISPLDKTILNCILLLGIFVVPVTYSMASVYLMNRQDPTHYYIFFTYGHKTHFTISVNAYLFIKSCMSSLLDPIFTSCVTFIYCLLCHRSCRLLVRYRKKMVDLLGSETKPSKMMVRQLVADYGRLCRILERLQCVFSVPSFLLIIVDVMSSFTILASALLYSTEELTGPMIAENTFVMITSASLLIALIAFAAQVPVTMTATKMALQKLQEKRVACEGLGTSEDARFRLLQILKERPLVVLSGCEIIYFTRITIVTILGTLFTYGLLIIQLK